ncbi:hypothetical protein EUX98_g3293 [Antrodiella citrinella]|uniref:non-specific serine/threonine protein kinase n=1 Tax=Antrodiella citrinella TaxID=2447956 RepID=A0A4S4MWY9_9APHY|nr:hypothetical protein EUX98_g3293 [Antrodiella citrinella]
MEIGDPLPPEIWLHIASELVKDGKSDVQNLTLTNSFFRDLTQPPLFTTLDMKIHSEFSSDPNPTPIYFHTTQYNTQFLEYLAFLNSPRIASRILNVHLGRMDHEKPLDNDRVDALVLVRTVFERISSFTNLLVVEMSYCPIDTYSLSQLLAVPHLGKLSLYCCYLRLDGYPAIPKSFKVTSLSVYPGGSHSASRYTDTWWMRLLLRAEEVSILDEAMSASFISFLALVTSRPLHSLRELDLCAFAPEHHDFQAVLWACPALESIWINTMYYSVISNAIPPIPYGAAPSLTFICAPWLYLRIYLRHPSVRRVWMGDIPHGECLIRLREVYTLRPELTAIRFRPEDPLSTDEVEFVLTHFRSLEKFEVSVHHVTEQIFQGILDLLLTADLAPTLRMVSVNCWSTIETMHTQAASAELSSRLRQKCPLLASVQSIPPLDTVYLEVRIYHIIARLDEIGMAGIDGSTSESSANNILSKEIAILKLVDAAIPTDNPKDVTDDSGIAPEEAQDVIDKLWDLLGRPNSLSEKSKKIKLSLAGHHRKLPSALILQDVQFISNKSEATDGFFDIHSGQYKGNKVALKSLRTNLGEIIIQSVRDEMLEEFFLDVISWNRLRHTHILPLLGVSEHAEEKICMVLPWEDRGNVKDRIIKLRENAEMDDSLLVSHIHKWLLHVALGLDYLHEQNIVHGNLHGGNILIDKLDNARLTDFGLGEMIAYVTPLNLNHAPKLSGFSHRAPELHYPHAFGRDPYRPTPSSDVYAFACTAVELYTDKPPFSDLSPYRISTKVVNGERPRRPLTAEGVVMSNSLWHLTQQCWVQYPKDRPPVKNVVRDMKVIVFDGLQAALQSEIATHVKSKEALENQASSYVKEIAQLQGMLSWHEQEFRHLKEAFARQEKELVEMTAQNVQYRNEAEAIIAIADQLKQRRERGSPASIGISQ